MPFSNRLGAVGFLTLSCLLAPCAAAGERAVMPIAFKAESRENISALSRYLPRLSEEPATQPNTALNLTQPAVKASDAVLTPSETAVLEAVLANSRDRSTAALAKDCTLAAPIPSNTFVRDAVAAR